VPATNGVSPPVFACSWEGYGLRLALTVDSSLLFANIQPDYMWAYFNNTLVFSFKKPDRQEMCAIFWDTAIDEKHVKFVKSLISIKACGEYCVLVSRVDEKQGQYVLMLCNAVGCPIENKFISITPLHVDMNKTHVIICSEDTVYYWQYRSQYAKFSTLEASKKKKAGKENAFHIDEIPNPNSIYDKDKWVKP
jgi:WD repeat-containing protein 35